MAKGASLWPKTPFGCLAWILAVVVGVAIFQITGLGDFLSDLATDPGSKVPHPGEIDLPGVK
jgi:hypothetical protein